MYNLLFNFSLLAPHISSGIFWEIAKLWMKGCKVIVLDIPLLFETKMDRWTNPVIVVWVNPETQIERLMSRDGCSEEQAQNRINAQLALDWKKSEADIVIDNSGSLDDTKQQFQEVLRKVSEPLTWKERLRSRDGLYLYCHVYSSGGITCPEEPAMILISLRRLKPVMCFWRPAQMSLSGVIRVEIGWLHLNHNDKNKILYDLVFYR